MTGSTFHEFSVDGYRITREKDHWYAEPMPGGSGMSWYGTNIAGTDFQSLYAYYVSLQGKIETPEIDDDAQRDRVEETIERLMSTSLGDALSSKLLGRKAK